MLCNGTGKITVVCICKLWPGNEMWSRERPPWNGCMFLFFCIARKGWQASYGQQLDNAVWRGYTLERNPIINFLHPGVFMCLSSHVAELADVHLELVYDTHSEMQLQMRPRFPSYEQGLGSRSARTLLWRENIDTIVSEFKRLA